MECESEEGFIIRSSSKRRRMRRRERGSESTNLNGEKEEKGVMEDRWILKSEEWGLWG